jgi:hypothetical protein
MLQRGFTTEPGGEQVWVFDKRTGKSFTSSIRAMAAERGYYDLEGSAALDAVMNKADGLASSIINKIRDRRSIAGLNDEDRGMLAVFVTLQLLRTRGYQEGTRHIKQSLHAILAEKTDGAMLPGWEKELTADQLRVEYLATIPKFTAEFACHIVTKNLLLFRTNPNLPFCISDNPVALHNSMNPGDGIRGTRGLAVKGIEIYLPISSELTMAFICPSVGQWYESCRDELWSRGGFISQHIHEFLQARDTGRALTLKPEGVRFQNSLQARNAERFVISPVNNFSDAADMVANYPDARTGPRATAQ